MKPIRFRFAPTLSGYLHVGNLRTLLIGRWACDAFKASLVMRVDDCGWYPDELQAALKDHLLRSIEAAEVVLDDTYLWSDLAPDAFRLLASALDSPAILSLMKNSQQIRLQECVGVAMDQLDHVHTAIRGVDLLVLNTREQWVVNSIPGWHMVDTRWCPVVTWNGESISKSGGGLEVEPETTVLEAVKKYGAERLKAALLSSWLDSPENEGINDWDEIKRRWLE